MDILYTRFDTLLQKLKSYKKPLLALSGGVDSTFLAYSLHEAKHPLAEAITISSIFYAEDEIERAKLVANRYQLRLTLLELGDQQLPVIEHNPEDRCYQCKQRIFTRVKEYAAEHGFTHIIEGTNAGDMSGYRPGFTAVRELHIESPLYEVGISKSDIRELARNFHLDFADQPSFSCFATRFPYGEQLTRDKLKQVSEAEEYLKHIGLRVLRVRSHNGIARIEADQEGVSILMKKQEEVAQKLRSFGFDYVTLDLEGFRSGSMDLHIKRDSE